MEDKGDAMADKETVLVLTTNLFFMPRIEAAAEAGGMETVSASTAARLMEAVGTHIVPIVLVDLEMDEPVWTEALQSLKAAKTAGTKVIAYGPHGEPDTLRKARDLGSDVVLIKRDFSEGLVELLASRGASASG
jgi:DNA-binding NarL/FixJ family response regulator